MKAILEYTLPEEEPEHSYALAGLDALLVIEEISNEIRNYLKYGGGEFREFRTDVWNDETSQFDQKTMSACSYTLEKVAELIYDMKRNRNLPELV